MIWNQFRQRILQLVMLIVIFSGCTSLPPLPPPAEQPPIPAAAPARAPQADVAYVIGPEDVLNITVFGQEDLSSQVVVSPDGAFAYPVLGEVHAAGLTARELEQQLAGRLAEYLVTPQVSVKVAEFQSQLVQVLGEVRKPGPYGLKHATTLLDMLAEAGGPTPDAGWEVIVVRRSEKTGGTASQGSDGKTLTAETRLRVDLEKLLRGEVEAPLMVQGGDTVYVPRATFFYVSGEVDKPGRYPLQRDTTVAKALTVAGGTTRFAAKSRLKVRRLIEGQRREFHARMTDLLQPEDVLIVPESIF